MATSLADSNQIPAVSGAPLLILTSLASSDRHGHALMKDVERFAGVHLGPGTLYKAIARLESLGYIEAREPQERRRPYGITTHGRAVLERSLDDLGRVVDEGRDRLGLRRPESPAAMTHGVVSA